MRQRLWCRSFGLLAAVGALVAYAVLPPPARAAADKPGKDELTFPLGTATPSEECGGCHQAIFREYAYGFGSDNQYKEMILHKLTDPRLRVPHSGPAAPTAHAYAGTDPWPIHARGDEVGGKHCDVCHYPVPWRIPLMDTVEIAKPVPRPPDQQAVGITCASCHFTPEGAMRGPHAVQAPHKTVVEPALQTSAMCAYCHSMGKRLVGRQTQTFLEWREDFHNAGLGPQHCQDCHMPRTMRPTAEDLDLPARAVGRHLWTGAHSFSRLHSALTLTALQPKPGSPGVEFHLTNVGAGHSVPTGSNRRAIYLRAEAVDAQGKVLAERQWMFAPFFGYRPDDRRFLEEDKALPEAVAASQADAQGPHEAIIRAGEDRRLDWQPDLPAGDYTVRARLIYDLNRYNDLSYTADQTELLQQTLALRVK